MKNASGSVVRTRGFDMAAYASTFVVGVSSALRQTGSHFEAKARLIAFVTTMTQAHARALRAQAAEVRRALRLAQGTRAVNDAIACHEQGDVDARDREVRRAYQLLPGLAEQDVTPLLERIEPWKAAALASRESSPQPKSSTAKRIAFCDATARDLQ